MENENVVFCPERMAAVTLFATVLLCRTACLVFNRISTLRLTSFFLCVCPVSARVPEEWSRQDAPGSLESSPWKAGNRTEQIRAENR